MGLPPARITTGTPVLGEKQTELEAIPDSEAHWAVLLESSKWWQAEQAGVKAVAVEPQVLLLHAA